MFLGQSYIKPPRWPVTPNITDAPDLWRDAVAVFPMWGGPGNVVYDVLNGHKATLGSGVQWQPSNLGTVASFRHGDRSTQYIEVENKGLFPEGQSGEELSVWALQLFDIDPGTDGEDTGTVKFHDGNDGYMCGLEDNGTENVPMIRTSGGNNGDPGVSANIGVWQTLAYSWVVGSEFRIHLNGRRIQSTASTDTSSVASGEPLYIGVKGFEAGKPANLSNNPSGFTGLMGFWMIRRRRAEDIEFERFHADPFAMLRPSPSLVSSLWFDMGAAGTFVTVTDTAQGTDTIAGISNTLKVSDSGTGQETLGQQAALTVQDSGQGTDAVQGPSVSLTVQDTAQGSDIVAGLLAALTVADTGAGVDSVTVDTGATQIVVSDSGTGTDAISVPSVSLTVQDTATGQDLIQDINALLTVNDTATAADIVDVIKTKLVKVRDSGVGTDAIGDVSVSLTVSDFGQATDAINQILASVAVSDSGQGVENITAVNIDQLPSGRVRVTFNVKAPGISWSG